MTYLKSAWEFVKKYWKWLALVVGEGVALYLLFYKKKSESVADQFNQINAAHVAEIQSINAARADEKAQLEQHQQALESTLNSVKIEHAAAVAQAQETVKIQTAQAAEKYKDNEDALAAELAAKLNGKLYTKGDL